MYVTAGHQRLKKDSAVVVFTAHLLKLNCVQWQTCVK